MVVLVYWSWCFGSSILQKFIIHLFLFKATKSCRHKFYITPAINEILGKIANHFLLSNHPPMTTNQVKKRV